MNSQKLLFAKTLVAAALGAAGLGASGVAYSITANNGSPDDGVQCVTAPKAYTGSLVNNRFLCKRTTGGFTKELKCTEPGFTTKFIREGSGGGGKDVCAAPNRSYPTGVPLTGTPGIDYKFFVVDNNQVNTIVATQRQVEATANGLPLEAVDARVVSSEIDINNTGSEDKLKVVLEFSVFATPAPGGIIGNPSPIGGLPGTVTTSTTPFVPKTLPR